MSINKGYLTAKTDKASDEVYTPFYAVEPIIKYVPKNWKIWCPFDKEWSAFCQLFREHGYEVITSHIDEELNFFFYEPEKYDVIISNPPFSIKDDVLKRLQELSHPFAMLLPLPTLQGKKRFPYLQGIQYLGFDKRINYYTDKECKQVQKGVAFASCYLCYNLLPKDLIIEELNVYERKLI